MLKNEVEEYLLALREWVLTRPADKTGRLSNADAADLARQLSAFILSLRGRWVSPVGGGDLAGGDPRGPTDHPGKKQAHPRLLGQVPVSELPREYALAWNLTGLQREDQVARVYELFCDHFGGFEHRLTAYESEHLRLWLSEHSPELVFLAIAKAVANNRISLKYVDRILLNWSRRNIKSLHAAFQADLEFEERRDSNGGRRETRGGKSGRPFKRRVGQSPGETEEDYVDEELW